jgi:hypothetical protein
LFRLLYPRFYYGTEKLGAPEIAESPPIKLSGPDYQAIGIKPAAQDTLSIVGFRNKSKRKQRTDTTTITRLYFSLAFPLDFIEFRDRVIEVIEEILEHETKAVGGRQNYVG